MFVDYRATDAKEENAIITKNVNHVAGAFALHWRSTSLRYVREIEREIKTNKYSTARERDEFESIRPRLFLSHSSMQRNSWRFKNKQKWFCCFRGIDGKQQNARYTHSRWFKTFQLSHKTFFSYFFSFFFSSVRFQFSFLSHTFFALCFFSFFSISQLVGGVLNQKY